MENTLNLNQYGVQEMDANELKGTEGGVLPLVAAGAVVAGAAVLVVGALVGYAVYKAVDWLLH